MLCKQQALNKWWMNKQEVTATKPKAQSKKRDLREQLRHPATWASLPPGQPDMVSCLQKQDMPSDLPLPEPIPRSRVWEEEGRGVILTFLKEGSPLEPSHLHPGRAWGKAP